MKVQCGSCQREYAVPERLAGKRLRCKNCSEAIQVPALQEEEPPPDALFDLAGDSAEQIASPPPLATASVKLAPARRARPADDPQSLKAFRSRFGDYYIALGAFAKATAGRLSLGRVTHDCCNCHREGDIGVYEIQWTARLRRGSGIHWTTLILIWFGVAVFSSQTDIIGYKTYHRICNRCRASSITFGLIGGIGWAISALLCVLGVCAIALGIVFPIALIAGIGITLISLLGMGFMRRLKVLRALRGVGPRPFMKEKMRQVA